MEKRISIIGGGNVAWHLAKAFDSIGRLPFQLFCRNSKQVDLFKKDFPSISIVDSLAQLETENTFIFLAISDEQLPIVAKEPHLKEAFLIHCSGSTSIDVFENKEHGACFYPLQSFTKGIEADWKSIPIFIEANSIALKNQLFQIGNLLSNQVSEVSSTGRLQLHLAAVFASNFTNHMISISQKLIASHGISAQVFDSLIRNTLSKAIENPIAAQTGPAKRNDVSVLQQHVELLSEFPSEKQVYQLISSEIQKYQRDDEL